ncbi:putative bifunctional diguanylate cyclase/phosphodiesterase [Aquicella lusitana]|uniref:cyclic-guanylate-specific phosphodiesterase n=1 Tax=Aquicella lusitana TaxID=254246 RepID=A0A370GFY4_9COXI|nr:EAL domain-containing protein [Aquicella lusitana]RDI42715.1 EAL domain-containing protein (putative c-di-GMP-specific phosphodiesterase class I) [Aquicella lusitana]VVC73430.1 Phytochrome-like protein cph2 [Aquicella lusitana]
MDSGKEKLKKELLRAIKSQEFVLYYQPQFNLTTAKFDGVEALIRWQHPERGILLPADFISVAEESGLIVRIGEWVVKTACKQNKAWQKKGLPFIRVAVNVSGKQFQQNEFVEFVMQTLQKFQLKPQYLELELTENIIIHDDDEKIIHTIHRLKKLGVQIALDDFGTGYSSISYLKKIPIDRIKIDRTYIQNINANSDDAAIVRAIIALATTLNLEVLAEGVESLRQLEMLISQDCKEAQGFYFSKPLPAEEVEKFLIFYQNNPFL